MPAFAQSTFGSFVGTVKDSSGAVIADAVVTATNTGTSAQRNAVSDATGNYVLVNMEPGMYEIKVEAKGFQPASYKGITLLTRQTVRIDGTVSVAQQVETVNVSASSEAVITTEVSNIAETKTGRELIDLPLALGARASGSTSAISTLTTQSGVQTDNSGNLSVAGAKPGMLSVSVDGISTMSPRTSAPIAELFPSFGTIAEIRVSAVNNAAEFGGVSDITTVSKGGTNSFHGGVFYNLQNTAMNARNTFSAVVPKNNMNNFGGYGGGRIIKDKTFFFSSVEILKLPRQVTITNVVPSLAFRSGDLSSVTTPIKDPTTGLPFANNQIPVSPIAAKALQYLFPLPNANGAGFNYVQNMPTPITSQQGDGRVDHNISASQTIFVRGTYKMRAVQDVPSSTGTALAGPTILPERDYSFTLAYNYVITPRIVNEFRAGATGIKTVRSTAFNAKQLISQIGLTVLDAPDGAASPNFSIAGYQGTGSNASQFNKGDTFQILDNITMNRGAHTLKAGTDIRRVTGYFGNVFAQARANVYTYNGSVTNPAIGNPFAAFLLGYPDRSQNATVTQPDSDSKSIHWAFYVQDDWKASPRLTINYGLRWEYHPPFIDRKNNIANFLPDYFSVQNGQTLRGAVVVPDDGLKLTNDFFRLAIAPTPIITASKVGVSQTLHDSQKSSFAPRIGFAYRATADGKTVIRGGYGRFIQTLLSSQINAGWAVSGSNVGVYNSSLVNGKPTLAFPNPFPANLAQPGTATFELAAAQNYKDPYVHQWNFTVERDLGFNTGVRVSYDGNHGSQIGYTRNLAQLPANTVGFAKANATAPFPIWGHISQYTNGARSNYNALTVAVNKRLSKGLQVSTSYAFAKNMSNGQGFNPTTFASEQGGMVTDMYNIDLDYGPVVFTHKSRFLTTFLYEMPFGKGKMFLGNSNKILDRVVGGWQLSGVMLFQTGAFQTVVAPSSDPAGNNFVNLEAAGRADIVSGANAVPDNQSISNWVNKAAFAAPGCAAGVSSCGNPTIGRPGNSPIGAVVGPGTQAISLSLFKSIDIREGVKFQIGAAASNALNHPNYGLANMNYGTAQFGTISTMQTQENGGPRSVQVTARISF